MSNIRELVRELRIHVCKVAALTAAVSTSMAIVDTERIDRLQSLATVSEDYADESLAMTDRLLSQLDRTA